MKVNVNCCNPMKVKVNCYNPKSLNDEMNGFFQSKWETLCLAASLLIYTCLKSHSGLCLAASSLQSLYCDISLCYSLSYLLEREKF